MQERNNVLEMKNISKSFVGVAALKNVHFELRKGEVLALIGENGAGKSTLMKILVGLYQADEGEIIYNGEKVHFSSPSESIAKGISMTHQETNIFPLFDVAENIWIGRESLFIKNGLLSADLRYQKTTELLTELGIDLDPKQKVRDLSPAMKQLLELARAVSYDSQIIIMDEPTSSLSDVEVELMFKIIRKLAAEGKSMIFISHKLEEIFGICDRVSVLRDGEMIGTRDCKDLTMEQLISMVVGRTNTKLYHKAETTLGETMLEVKHLSQTGVFEDVSFQVRAGEVLGFSGLIGCGRTEIMSAVFGMTKKTSGEVLVAGKPVKIRGPYDAIRHGLGMLTEDRLKTGAIYRLSVLHNGTLSALNQIYKNFVLAKPKNEVTAFEDIGTSISIKYADHNEMISQLSGGNQQKVLFARWMMIKPKVLILDEPTRGIDVGSKNEIYKIIDMLASKGMAIILISSEMPELLSLSDRICVVREGKIVYEVDKDHFNQEAIMAHSFGV